MADIHQRTEENCAIINLGGDLTVHHAHEVKAVLLDAVQSSASVEVILGKIGGLDTSLPQLICSAHRMAADLNKRLTVKGADQERVADMLRSTGFTRHTGCRENARTSCLWLHGPVSE
jgi:anti-anti-sigma factor